MIIEDGMEKVELLGGPMDGYVVLVPVGKVYRPPVELLTEWGLGRTKPIYTKLYDGYYKHTGDDRYTALGQLSDV